MNTKDEWTTTATIHDEQRRALWIEVFENATMPIKSILPAKANVPEHENAEVYMLDLAAITDEQREKLVVSIARRFDIHPAEVAWELDKGVPILAEGVSVSSTDQGMLFSLTDDELSGDEWDLDEDLFHHQEFEDD